MKVCGLVAKQQTINHLKSILTIIYCSCNGEDISRDVITTETCDLIVSHVKDN